MEIKNNNLTEEGFLRGVPALSQPADHPAGVVRASAIAGLDASRAAIAPAMPPNAVALLSALRRRYKLIISVGTILAALAAVGTWFLIPLPKYTARAILDVAASHPKIIFKTEENRVDFGTYQRTQLSLIKSRAILNKSLSDPEVSKLKAVREQVDPVLWIEKRVQADFLGEFLRISMSGDDPKDLAILVNAVSVAYIDDVVGSERRERSSRQMKLQELYRAYQKSLEQRRGDLKKLAEQVGSKDKQTLRYIQELAIERMSTSRRELIQSQSDLRKAKAELQIRLTQEQKGTDRAVIPETAIRQFIEEDPEVIRIRARIDQLKGSIAKVERIVRDRADPAAQNYRTELGAYRKKLDARMAAVRPLALEYLGRGGPDSEVAIERGLRVRIKVLEELNRVTQAVYDAQAAETQGINQGSNYIDSIQDEIAHADNAAKRIGEELEVLKVELEAPPRIRLRESADTPRQEDDKRLVMSGMAGLGMFGLFLLAVTYAEFRTRRISSIEEVVHWLGLRVVGALPPLYDSAGRGLLHTRRSKAHVSSLLTDSIDSIRTMLLHSTADRSLRSIIITSATGGEGKTSLACHLATSLARSGMRTLLIDCDLRKPTIHRIYDVPATPGFSEFLRGEVGADAVIRPTTADGPSMITAGACNALALRALAQAAPGAIFDVFRKSFDIVVVDTSPILPVTDALLVGRHVDAAVYSILRDVSRLPWTLAAMGRLKALNIRILGAVVTGIRPESYGTYYGQGYSEGVDHG
jgi:succinoglycan biosynthesis transport protein ExoP